MSETQRANLTGSCACGAVQFEFTGPLRPVIACHCGTCRRTSGHYWAATQCHRRNLALIEERGLKWFDSSHFARRGFCAECGASLFFERHDSGRISIAAGALDAPTHLQMVEHICMAEASDYYDIEAVTPQHAGNEISEHWLLPADDGE